MTLSSDHPVAMAATDNAPTTGRLALEARGIVKRFGHVTALRGADLWVGSGELVALVGDNGAGKSTFVNVLSGVMVPDEGRIAVEGRPVAFHSPIDAREHGIETVYQSLALAPLLDAAENLYLGRQLRLPGLLGRLGFVNRTKMRLAAAAYFRQLGLTMPSVAVPISLLSGGQRQMVAVARAAAFSGRVVFLDEPTAALAAGPTRHVLQLIDQIRASGVGVVLISHDLRQVTEVADRIFVLRRGRTAAVLDRGAASVEDLIAIMTGAREEANRAG
jgi:simple sugar transport system ATP-binding protein